MSTARKESDRAECERKLDQALELTFPASDPVAVGRPTSTELAVQPAWSERAPPTRGPQVMPAIRALARKLEVDLNLVQGSGPGGSITRGDVERAARSLAEAGPAEPLRGMRRAMAQRMATAHAEICSDDRHG